MIVIDASVVAKWFFPEVLTDQALLLLERWTSATVNLVAPALMLVEVGNIVWKKQRTHQITLDEGEQAIDDLLGLNLTTVEDGAFLTRAYQLAQQYDRTVYDALYLAVAEALGASFITADQRLCNTVGIQLSFVQYLGDYT
jgi:predicted nucleic acid-binding protein